MPAETHLWRLHVEDLGDAALHYEEVRVIDVQLHRTEQVLHAVVLHVHTVDGILVPASDYHL